MSPKKIAIIGSGISGLTCAYHLSRRHEVTVFEAADYIGGHTHTVEVEKEGELSNIDTGFIVFNDRTYPNFISLMQELRVPYQPSEMSFSVRNDAIDLEYNGNNLNTLFAQRMNLLGPGFWRMLADILRFNRDVRRQKGHNLTIGEYLACHNYSRLFRDNYLLPMISAIWSMGMESCVDFPLDFFVRFFDNHGLLDLNNRPQWYTIGGGSSGYITPLTAPFRKKIRLNTPVVAVRREQNGVAVRTREDVILFDEVVLACHGDQALGLLDRPTDQERVVLGAFRCTDNQVVVHTDISHLPRRRLAWASWNYRMLDAAKEQTTLTYNMNILQRLNKKHTYLVTLNQDVAEEHVLARYTYRHPVYTARAIQAQEQWPAISGVDRIHFCGAYWFNGFHEDGVKSGLRVSQMLEGRS
jgi:uncharacterized protein